MQRRSTKKKLRKQQAGKAFAEGGFGCVFRPSITCQDPLLNNKLNMKPYITKLMKKSEAKSEMAENTRILSVVKKIPNYTNFFLLDDVFECPNYGPLTEEDKYMFNTTCSNLMKYGITTDNLNTKSSKQKLSAINIPDGGTSIYEIMKYIGNAFIQQHNEIALEKFGRLNWSLIHTLENAVIPMNKLGLLHLDLKGENMLVHSDFLTPENSNTMTNVYIIDWGLSGLIDSSKTKLIPEVLNRPLQFNVPFSNILFSTHIQKYISTYCEVVFPNIKTDKFLPKSTFKPLAAFILHNNAKRVGYGHTKYIIELLQFLSGAVNVNTKDLHKEWNISYDCFQNSSLVYNYVVDYIAKILERYLYLQDHTQIFNSEKYFNEVYRHNVDVWGFIMSYLDFCVSFKDKYSTYRSNPLALHITDLLFKYCFSDTYAADKIPVDKLVRDLKYLSILCGVPKPTKAKPKLKPLVFYEDDEIMMPEGKKRCPRGYRIIANTNKCRKIITHAKTKKSK